MPATRFFKPEALNLNDRDKEFIARVLGLDKTTITEDMVRKRMVVLDRRANSKGLPHARRITALKALKEVHKLLD